MLDHSQLYYASLMEIFSTAIFEPQELEHTAISARALVHLCNVHSLLSKKNVNKVGYSFPSHLSSSALTPISSFLT